MANAQRASTTFQPLPRVVKPGDRLFLNDGLVQLVVDRVAGNDVECTVAVGGELRSRKGLNLPGIDLGISAFTEHDRACLEFALGAWCRCGEPVVRRTRRGHRGCARGGGKDRARALHHREDRAVRRARALRRNPRGRGWHHGRARRSGVEVPIEEIAHTQKQLIAKANLAGKPVITATQMLESMVQSRLPTRAEATDVANAILDGTDCVMLSGESAMGKFPEEAVTMLAKIAAFTETHRPRQELCGSARLRAAKATSQGPATAWRRWSSTRSTRFHAIWCSCQRAAAWSRAPFRVSNRPCGSSRRAAIPLRVQELAFSYGVYPIDLAEEPDDWRE